MSDYELGIRPDKLFASIETSSEKYGTPSINYAYRLSMLQTAYRMLWLAYQSKKRACADIIEILPERIGEQRPWTIDEILKREG